MTISAKIILDSLAPCGARLTTFELHYPRFIHSEFMTHREFSRNASSSRAIPMSKMRELIKKDPAMPVSWGKNQKGMRADEELSTEDQYRANRLWTEALNQCLEYHAYMESAGLHKQIANRILEPWAHMTTICSATSYENFFFQRCHKDAQPEIHALADCMRSEYQHSKPKLLEQGEWHTPYIREEDRSLIAGHYLTKLETSYQDVIETTKQVSIARCARVSYLTQDGRRDISEDLRLFKDLIDKPEGEPLHISPAEHVAEALEAPERWGNFVGFKQYRKTIPREYVGRSTP